jgi:hypothetical protein
MARTKTAAPVRPAPAVEAPAPALDIPVSIRDTVTGLPLGNPLYSVVLDSQPTTEAPAPKTVAEIKAAELQSLLASRPDLVAKQSQLAAAFSEIEGIGRKTVGMVLGLGRELAAFRDLLKP